MTIRARNIRFDCRPQTADDCIACLEGCDDAERRERRECARSRLQLASMPIVVSTAAAHDGEERP